MFGSEVPFFYCCLICVHCMWSSKINNFKCACLICVYSVAVFTESALQHNLKRSWSYIYLFDMTSIVDKTVWSLLFCHAYPYHLFVLLIKLFSFNINGCWTHTISNILCKLLSFMWQSFLVAWFYSTLSVSASLTLTCELFTVYS